MVKIKAIDYHLHSNNSFDSKQTISEMCKGAIEKGLGEICFTEHYSILPNEVSYKYLDYDKFTKEIEECRETFSGKLSIKKGLEIGEPYLNKEELAKNIENMDLDFIIGSVHNIDDLKLRTYMKGKEKDQNYLDYFKEVYKVAKYSDVDVLGHLDLMKRYAYKDFGNYEFNSYKEIIQEILKEAIKRGIGIELNTSGFRNDVGEPYPSIDILKMYKNLGGEILTIGSDSHSIDFIGENFHDGVDILKSIGFKYIFKYEKRRPQGIEIKGRESFR